VAKSDATFDDLFGRCRQAAVHLEMRDGYATDDAVFIDWKAGRTIEPATRWPGWFSLIRGAVARGVVVRRARIVSEPVTEYIRYEYEVTQGLNIAAGEQVRWLPRRQASALTLPGNDFWLFDNSLVQFNHFSGDGEWLGVEATDDPELTARCSSAFEAVWKHATPHADYRPT
jgi:hypothetical protein